MSDPGPEERPVPQPEHSLAPRKPRTIGGVVYLLVLGTTAFGIALVLLDVWRVGLTVMGGALLAGAVARLLIPGHQAGMLGIRRKLIDVTTLTLLGGGLVTLAAVIPNQPV